MIIDRCRNIEELKNLYKDRPMPNQYDFDFIVNNPYLFCFYDEEKGFLRGFITIQKEIIDGIKRLTLSGTSIRKNMSDNIDAIICVCKAFNENIYAVTPLKHAALVLKKAGFKKIKDKIYMRCKNG